MPMLLLSVVIPLADIPWWQRELLMTKDIPDYALGQECQQWLLEKVDKYGNRVE